ELGLKRAEIATAARFHSAVAKQRKARRIEAKMMLPIALIRRNLDVSWQSPGRCPGPRGLPRWATGWLGLEDGGLPRSFVRQAASPWISAALRSHLCVALSSAETS